ncbi:MAG: KilA-N domain-containing protein [Anaeroplasma sp.]|nr:KilA-N domain-containing protein [Anaeroplasma sp.]
MKSIIVKDKIINITGISDDDYISLTDIARIKNSEDANMVISSWMRKVDTLEFLKLWEQINNINFKPTDFEGFKSKPGQNAFTISPKRWIELTNSIGIKVKSGRYNSGTFAHKDITLEFASWISAEVKLYIIKEFQRLKIQESEQLEWQGNRLLTKLIYLIHADAIKENLIPVNLSSEQINYIYASEADMLNVALFGVKAKEELYDRCFMIHTTQILYKEYVRLFDDASIDNYLEHGGKLERADTYYENSLFYDPKSMRNYIEKVTIEELTKEKNKLSLNLDEGLKKAKSAL